MMKKKMDAGHAGRAGLTALSFCVLLPMFSCKDDAVRRQAADGIERVWQLAETSLPEALVCAEGLRDSVGALSEYERQRFDLLSIRLRDKCDVVPSAPDSAIHAMDFFSEHGTDVDRQRACFYLGSAYRDLKDYPRAVECFLRAADIAGQCDAADTLVWQNSLSQLRHIYMLLLCYEEELDVARKAVGLAEASSCPPGEGAKRNLGWYLMDVATAYRHLGDTLRCCLYCDSALEAVSREDFPPRYGAVLAELLAMYSRYGCHDRLDSLLGQLQRLPADRRPHNYELALALFHEKVNRTDSAICHYMSYYNSEESLTGRYEASAGLQRCFLRKGDFRRTAEWGCRLYDTNDSIIARRAFEETQRARDTYVYYRDKERERSIVQMGEAASRRSQRIVLLSVSAVLALLSVVMGVLALYNYKKKRLMEQLVGKDRELGRALGELRQKERTNRSLVRMALMNESTDDTRAVIELFSKASVGQEKPDEDSWRDLISATETMYPGFLEALQERMRGSLNEQLLRTACLLKIGMKQAQIANIMNTSRQTVWNRIKRLEESGLPLTIDY